MPVVSKATVHEMHGTRFSSYVNSASGSAELCAWRIDVAAGTEGVRHRPSKEEVLAVLAGQARVTLDGQPLDAKTGEVIVVPAGASFQLDNPGPDAFAAWVTTSVGLTAELADGSTIAPPWAN